MFKMRYGIEHPFIAYPLTGLGQACIALDDIACASAALGLARDLRTRHETAPSGKALTEFYWHRTLWQAGHRRADTRQALYDAYRAYLEAPGYLAAETEIMKTWLDSQVR